MTGRAKCVPVTSGAERLVSCRTATWLLVASLPVKRACALYIFCTLAMATPTLSTEAFLTTG
jgi:hypothetical protein